MAPPPPAAAYQLRASSACTVHAATRAAQPVPLALRRPAAGSVRQHIARRRRSRATPAAEYEIASRYAEGRGVPQTSNAAAEWFERAAKQGLAPAQFRLGGLYEKGLGVKKNSTPRRRFYLPPARPATPRRCTISPCFMPRASTASRTIGPRQWFRKAADHGVADSQYNLGILYARGIGVEQNLAEPTKWFALAAREGDTDAAKKRDDVAGRLDQQSLVAARAGGPGLDRRPAARDRGEGQGPARRLERRRRHIRCRTGQAQAAQAEPDLAIPRPGQ